MKIENVFKSIIRGTAILITGSGAHLGVKTPNDEEFPSGVNLAKELYRLCGVDNPENVWDLQDASETYQEHFSSEGLVQEITRQLRVGCIQEEHRNLYSFNWQRVYTTNYDDVPLIATSKNPVALIPVTLKTPRREHDLENNLCVYINGYIGQLTPEKLNDEFKLTGKSYLSANGLEESEWGAVFDEDIETADCIVVVGLSLEYDLDIKRFIFNKKVIEKTVFIESPSITEDKNRKLKRMGSVETLGMKVFVQKLCEFQNKNSISTNEAIPCVYKSFEIYVPKRPKISATSIEVYDLFMIGQMKDSLWHRKAGKYDQIIFRKKLFDVILAIQNGVKVIYLHAKVERYENILKNIISYSHVKTFLIESKQKEFFLINYYNGLKELDYYKENSFYWLQYSIACANIERFDLAQIYLDNAYGWFRESDKIVPFQLDTQQAKLNLLMIEKRKTTEVKEKFIEAHQLLMKPVVSIKDNPIKQIMNFWSYTKNVVKNQMVNQGYGKEYRDCCAEAYNKLQGYLKSSTGRQDRNNFNELSKRLLSCSVAKDS